VFTVIAAPAKTAKLSAVPREILDGAAEAGAETVMARIVPMKRANREVLARTVGRDFAEKAI
jgi:hypothetical protein